MFRRKHHRPPNRIELSVLASLGPQRPSRYGRACLAQLFAPFFWRQHVIEVLHLRRLQNDFMFKFLQVSAFFHSLLGCGQT